MSSLDDPTLPLWFRRLAKTSWSDGAPLYGRICEDLADDEYALELLGSAPVRQRRPVLLFAIVQNLLLEEVTHPLADYFPSVAWTRGRRKKEPTSVASDLFIDLCKRYESRIRSELVTRSTQTNEVGRLSAIRPGLLAIAQAVDEPIALIDLGSSAGLALRLDRYRYRCHGPHLDAVEYRNNADSEVVVDCEVRRGLPPEGMPHLAWAAGIDASPVDIDDESARRWLLACQWSDHVDRFIRLHAALDEAVRTVRRPKVRKGDLLEVIDEVAADAPREAHLVFTHTWVATYLSPQGRERLRHSIERVSKTRPVSWLFAENPVEVPDLGIPLGPSFDRSATALVAITCDKGVMSEPRRIADTHHHGRWLDWWGLASGRESATDSVPSSEEGPHGA